MKGLVRGTVSVVKHDPEWARDAGKCISLLKEILLTDMIDAQHVGSTAIAGICAKPIMDIAVGVSGFQDILKHDPELAGHGIYYRKQEHGGQLLYVCGDLEKEIITHHIHVVIWGSGPWNDYLNFRDYMNCHEKEAKAYGQLKEQLAELYSNERSAYTAGKQAFIGCVLRKAIAWRESCRQA